MSSIQGSRIHFFFKRPVSLQNRKKLKNFIETAFSGKKRDLQSLNIIFCTDRELLKINQKYLNHDAYTDIITFDYGKNRRVEGEIYISIDRIRENALTLNVPMYLELHRVVFHGILHLCGFKDKTSKDKGVMSRLEDKLLSTYFRSVKTV